MQPLPVLAAAAAYGLAVAPVGAQEADPATSPSLACPVRALSGNSISTPGWATSTFADSLYTNPKPEQPSGDLTDDWLEGFVKPALTRGVHDGKLRPVLRGLECRRRATYGAAPSLVGEDASSFGVEDLYVGWRSGNLFDLGENVLDFTLGRAQYPLGHGLLLWDGAAEGGSRGGYWTNARKAFEFAAIGRFRPGNHTVEGSISTRTTCRRPIPAASSGASTTSTRSARTRRSARPT